MIEQTKGGVQRQKELDKAVREYAGTVRRNPIKKFCQTGIMRTIYMNQRFV
jgi:hypothetical protein